ncbi:hypothetical protein GCM10010348_43300 [Streptomyces anthocyanicus]|nr:hypothetical protein GCM10010348_43300 [Streptomyces anthocyanicus]
MGRPCSRSSAGTSAPDTRAHHNRSPRTQRLLQHQPSTTRQPHLRPRQAPAAASLHPLCLRTRARGAPPVRFPQLHRPPVVVPARGEVHHHARVPDPAVHGGRQRGRGVHHQQITGPQQPRQLSEPVVRHLGAPRHQQPYVVPVEPRPPLLGRHPGRQLLRDPHRQGRHHRASSSAGAP